MIRRIVSILLAMMLLPCVSAAAEEIPEAASLCYLYQGETLVGVGAVFGSDSFVLTSGSLARRPGQLMARVGDRMLEVVDLMGESYDGPVLLALEDSTGLPPWQIAPVLEPEALGYLGVLADGTVVTGACARVAPAFAQGHTAMTLTAAEGLLPGALILDAYGTVAGQVVGVYGEGSGRYLAYTNEALFFLLTAMADGEVGQPERAADSPAAELVPVGYVPVPEVTLSCSGGMLHADWSAAVLDPANGEHVTVVAQDVANPYVTMGYYTLEETSCAIPVIPERVFAVWVLQSEEPASLDTVQLGSDYHLASTEPASPFTDYAFADTQTYVSLLPRGRETADTEVLPPASRLTTAMLESNDVYLQVTSTYQVETEHSAALVLALETPEGWALTGTSGYLFDPGVQQEDNWHISANDLIQAACSASQTGHLTPGSYVLSYYLDGKLASSAAFEAE